MTDDMTHAPLQDTDGDQLSPSPFPFVPHHIEINGDRWTACGVGIRFSVYSNGSEVAKLPLSTEQLLEIVGPHRITRTEAERMHRATLRDVGTVRARLMAGTLPGGLLGHPMIETSGWMFQKRYATFAELACNCNDDTLRNAIDSAITCIERLVAWGALVAHFSVPVDCGLDTSGAVLMIGHGGLVFDRERAVLAIKAKPWRTASSGVHMVPASMQQYFVERMEETFTAEFVAQTWGEELQRIRNGAR